MYNSQFNKMLDKRTYQLLQGSTLLDEKLFNKKKNFFYKTSYDILIKGDCGSSSSYLEIFKAIRKKAKIKPQEIERTTRIQTKASRNKNLNSTYTTNVNVFQDLNLTNKYNSLSVNQNQTNINKTLLSFRLNRKSKNTQNESNSFHKSNSIAYMGNTMENHKLFIKCLDNKISQLDNEIDKMNKEEIFKVPTKFSNDQRTKVLSLLRDYFPKKPFMIMKDRYNKLFGNEPYLKKIKKIKSRVSLDSKKLNRFNEKMKNENDLNNSIDDENNDNGNCNHKVAYLKVVNGGAIYNRKVVSNKYDTIGKVKILNIPKDFYYDITGINDKYSVGASNVKEMYSMIDQKEQQIINFAHHYYYSRGKKNTFNERLNEINDKFSKVEKDGKKNKNNILKLKCFLNNKSPLISDKIFAYVDDSPKRKIKKHGK